MAAIRVQTEDFDAAAEAAALTSGRADIGAVVTFIGLCRDEGGKLQRVVDQDSDEAAADSGERKLQRHQLGCLDAKLITEFHDLEPLD